MPQFATRLAAAAAAILLSISSLGVVATAQLPLPPVAVAPILA
ncbi:hypothetical protein [Porphyrobacter sp. GA68]|nr:hypothetical protein [Porphyrobacter sp. GA68]